MAHTGFWLRGAKGKLAGATIYKGADGSVIREVVKPKNPRTSRQMYQRAIMATVMRFYALGKDIFDHSFEGKSQGAMCQRHFMSLNAKRLRAILSSDLANNTKRGRVVAPGITTCVPNEYIISQGSYEQKLLTADATTGLVSFPAVGQDIETISEYAAANGLVDGDIYSIIAIGVSPDNFAYEYAPEGGYIQDASVALTHFNYLQLKVKAGTQLSTEAVSANTTIGEIFDVVFSGQQVIADEIAEAKLTDGVVFTDLTESPDYASGAIGIIRSHDDLGLRSNSIMQPVGAANWAGITAPYVNVVWQAGTQLGNSDLILEGVNFNEAGGSAEPTLPTELGFYGIRESFTSGGQTIVNPIVSFNPVDKNATIAFSGECDDVAGQADLWNIVDGEPEVSETVVGLTTSQINAFTSVICQYLSDKYGVEISASNCMTGDEGFEDVTLDGYM